MSGQPRKKILDPAFKNRDFYVPHFEVRIDDQKLSPQAIRDVIQIVYRDSLKDIDKFELQINNWDAENRKFKYSDDPLFDPGRRLKLSMGYYGKQYMHVMLTGEITSLRPTFPSSGKPVLAVSGLNILHRLRNEQRSIAYHKKTDKEIAREVARRLDIDIDVSQAPDATKYNYILQDNEYDILFLLDRARQIGHDLVVKEDKRKPELIFGPSHQVRQTEFRLEYGTTLIDFQPNLTTANQVNSVTVRGWDAIRKKRIEGTATRPELKVGFARTSKKQGPVEKAFSKRHEVVATQPIQDEAEARTMAKAILEDIAKDIIKGSGSVVGLPELRTGSILTLEGMGERFSGRYFVTGTTHTLGTSGYTTKFECRREEK